MFLKCPYSWQFSILHLLRMHKGRNVPKNPEGDQKDSYCCSYKYTSRRCPGLIYSLQVLCGTSESTGWCQVIDKCRCASFCTDWVVFGETGNLGVFSEEKRWYFCSTPPAVVTPHCLSTCMLMPDS